MLVAGDIRSLARTQQPVRRSNTTTRDWSKLP